MKNKKIAAPKVEIIAAADRMTSNWDGCESPAGNGMGLGKT